jgi:hypothetical protein
MLTIEVELLIVGKVVKEVTIIKYFFIQLILDLDKT